MCVVGGGSSGIILGDQGLEVEPAMGSFKQNVAEGTANKLHSCLIISLCEAGECEMETSAGSCSQALNSSRGATWLESSEWAGGGGVLLSL